MQITGQVPLRYTSNQYKYQQLTLVSENERCGFTQSTIKELYEGKIKRGFPHVLALVQDEERGQDVYDASALSENIARNKRWEWKNPNTNKKIKRIDFFAIHNINDGYLLLRKNKVNKTGNGQIYEDLWFCNNLAFASDSDNPYVFHSISAVIQHFSQSKDTKEEAKWRYNCYRSIENHYGKGIALLFSGYIIKSRKFLFLENFLFTHFKYTCFDDLFIGSKLDEWISKCKEGPFDRNKEHESYKEVKELFYSVLQEKRNLPGVKFAELLFKSIDNETLSSNELESFASDQHSQIAHLAQAALCTMLKSNVEKYMKNLTQLYPEWQLGRALLIDYNMENFTGEEFNKKLDNLISLSRARDTRDLLLLQLLADRFDEFGVTSTVWSSTENICMKILAISRFREDTSKQYAHAIKKDAEFENALFLLKNNVGIFDTYTSLNNLSNLQRELGIKNKDKELYLEGVRNGLRVFENRMKHNRLIPQLGRDLVAEITPYKASKEHENKGEEILREEFKRAPNNIFLKMLLGDYLIRKGTAIEASNALKSIEELKKIYFKDQNVHMSSIRAHLRFAEKREDLLIVEEMIRECEKLGTCPTLFLLKGLWQSHPLRRETLPDWYILASVNFKKAFENADCLHVQFLLDHLSRYDKLTEEDQIKCRTNLLELLGLG